MNARETIAAIARGEYDSIDSEIIDRALTLLAAIDSARRAK